MSFTKSELESKNLKELRKLCTDLEIQGRSKLKKKSDIIQKLLSIQTNTVAAVKRQIQKDKHAIITITCGDVAENHTGNQQIGNMVNVGHGFNLSDLEKAKTKFKNLGYQCEIHHLNDGLKEVKHNDRKVVAEDAYIMIIRKGLDAFIGENNASKFFDALKNLDWDKKYFDTRRQKVLNKHARHNLCFSTIDQEPDYPNGKGRIVSYQNVPYFNDTMTQLEKFFGPKAKKLQAEGNKYYDKSKTGIGYHGDSERRKVIAWRLGSGAYGDVSGQMSIHWQWYINRQPVGKNMKFIINSGDIYVMSEKATGNDWKKTKTQIKCPSGCRNDILPTLRHAAGSTKYTKIKK